MAIKKNRRRKMVLNLEGPEGNANVLLGTCSKVAKQLDLNWNMIRIEATSGDYVNLVKTLQKHFGDFVDFETDFPEKYK